MLDLLAHRRILRAFEMCSFKRVSLKYVKYACCSALSKFPPVWIFSPILCVAFPIFATCVKSLQLCVTLTSSWKHHYNPECFTGRVYYHRTFLFLSLFMWAFTDYWTLQTKWYTKSIFIRQVPSSKLGKYWNTTSNYYPTTSFQSFF